MNKTPLQILETDRLILRPTNRDDDAFILSLVNTPKFIDLIGDRNVRTLEDAGRYIDDRISPQINKLGFGNFTVIRKCDNTKIGSCGLYNREGIEGYDLGFAFLPEFERKGYGYESSSRLIRMAEELKIPELRAITLEQNHASQGLLKKLGFSFEKWVSIDEDPELLMCFYYKSDSRK